MFEIITQYPIADLLLVTVLALVLMLLADHRQHRKAPPHPNAVGMPRFQRGGYASYGAVDRSLLTKRNTVGVSWSDPTEGVRESPGHVVRSATLIEALDPSFQGGEHHKS